jgi:hypothetical protein
MHALPAPDAARQVQSINKLDAVHGLQISDMGTEPVFALHLSFNPLEHLLHLLRRHFPVVLLQELVHGRVILELAQRREGGRQRGEARRHHGRISEEAASIHLSITGGHPKGLLLLLSHINVLLARSRPSGAGDGANAVPDRVSEAGTLGHGGRGTKRTPAASRSRAWNPRNRSCGRGLPLPSRGRSDHGNCHRGECCRGDSVPARRVSGEA